MLWIWIIVWSNKVGLYTAYSRKGPKRAVRYYGLAKQGNKSARERANRDARLIVDALAPLDLEVRKCIILQTTKEEFHGTAE